MAALKALPRSKQLEFVRLRAIVEATEGNLGAHIGTLEKAGYIVVEKDFIGKKPRTRIAISASGSAAFDQHVAYLYDILGNAE